MCAAIVRRHHLDVLTFPPAVRLLVLDAHVWEMDLVVEVREGVFVGPLANLILCPIGVPVVVVVVLVALVQPALVLALQLVVEDHALNVGAALKPRLGLFVGTIELEVVFQFPRTREACVEGLVMPVIAVSMAFEKAAPCLGQRHRLVAVPGHARSLDQPLFA
jgi:hypothetical protein